MKSMIQFAIILLALLSHDPTLAIAQYVTTVTVSVNTNPFCTLWSGIGISGGGSGGFGGAGSAPGSGVSGTNGTGAGGSGLGSNFAPNGSTSLMPIDTPTGHYDALGYYPAPADGNLLGGPVTTSPLMTVAYCGAFCQGYSYIALENGDKCNCGSSPPSGPPSSSLPSKSKRQLAGGDCIPCAGDSAECCGAPGGYALVYHVTPEVQGSSGVEAPSTFYSPISSGSYVASTSTGSNGSVVVGSTTSYVAFTSASISSSPGSNGSVIIGSTTSYMTITSASIYSSSTFSTSSTINSSGSIIVGINSSYISSSALSSASTYNYSTTESADSIVVATPASNSSTVPAGTASGPSGLYTGSSGLSPSITGFSGFGTGSSGAYYPNVTMPNTIAIPTTANGTKSSTAVNGGNSSATGKAASGEIAGNPEVDSGTATSSAPTPSCVEATNYQGNNTEYTDVFGYTYDIRCNLDLLSTSTDHDAHAESFEDCLEYCSLLTDCVAVNYQDALYTPNNLSNCYPKWDFSGYAASATDGVYSGVNVNGSSPGTLESQDLCTGDNMQGSSYDGLTYDDDYGTAWTIGCNSTLAISNATALATTVTDTLASCVDYCSRYDSCDMVNWTGPHINGTVNDPNCFPASAIGTAGASGSAIGFGYAILNNS